MRRPPAPRPILTSLAAAMACGDAGSTGVDTGAAETTTPAAGSSEAAPTSGLTQSDESAGDGTDSAAATGTSTSTSGATSTTATSTTATPTSTGEASTDAELCGPPEPAPEDVPLNEACAVPRRVGAFEPVMEWKFGDGGFYGPPIVGQTIDTNGSGALDADDLPHVFIYEYGEVIAVRGDGSGVGWMTAAGKYKVGAYGAMALGDLEGDGWNEVVTAVNTRVCVLDGRDGAEKWCTVVPATSCDGNGYNNPSIADMDGDGLAEVILGSAILDATGVIIGVGALGHGAALVGGNYLIGDLSAAVDLDADGVLELVTGNAAYDLDGNTIWANGSLDGFIAVADFDHDGAGEIVKTSRYHVFGMETDGSIAWGPITAEDDFTRIGAPAIGDLDGDGTPELVYGARDEMVAREWGGAELWTAKLVDPSGAAGPVLFDFERDGYPEVVMADEMAVRVFDGRDGTLKFIGGKHISGTGLETPVVVDVDGDDHVELVVAHSIGTVSHGSISVWGDAGDTWPPGRKIWNQHAYHITNIGDLGEVPTKYQPNWTTGHNSFRSGDVGEAPGSYRDLTVEIVEVCEDRCAAGTLVVSARPRNAGNTEAPAGLSVTLRAGPGGDVVATLTTSEPVPPGKTGEVLLFEVAAADLARTQPVVTIDDPDALLECDEDNNTATWQVVVCTTDEPD